MLYTLWDGHRTPRTANYMYMFKMLPFRVNQNRTAAAAATHLYAPDAPYWETISHTIREAISNYIQVHRTYKLRARNANAHHRASVSARRTICSAQVSRFSIIADKLYVRYHGGRRYCISRLAVQRDNSICVCV